MSITPKNWNEFQHYKNRSPIWIKLHRKLLDNYDFNRLPLASKALAPMLWLLASEYDDGKITAPFEAIAFRLRITEQELIDALKPLIEADFFIVASKALARRKRADIPEKRREQVKTEKEKTIGRSQATRPDDFEDFWKVYPKRQGANPKIPARSLFLAAVKQGAEPSSIIEGARLCALSDADKIGTPYIPQAVKWLRDQRWIDYAAEPPASGLSDDERKQMFEKLRKPNGQRTGTDLRGIGASARQIERAGREEPAADADHQARHAGMVRLDPVFREPPGVRAGSDETGTDGDEPGIHGTGQIARTV